MERTGARDLRVAAIAAVAAAQAWVFGQVFSDVGAGLRLVVGALLAVGLATLFHRRGLFLAAVIACGAFVLLLAPLAFPSTTWFLIPTGRSLKALAAALEIVGGQARTEIAPTAATAPLVMAALASVWAAAFATHALLIRARAPFLAIVPGAALIVFAETALGPGMRGGRVLLLLGCVIAMMFTDTAARTQRIGRRIPAIRRPLYLTGIPGARRTGVAVIATALLVAAIAKPSTSGFGNSLGAASDVDPFVSLGAQLRSEQATPLFTVESPQGTYWRTLTLDAFDGHSWSRSIGPEPDSVPVIPGVPLAEPERAPDVHTLSLEQTISIQGWRGTQVPVAPDVQGASAAGIPLLFEPVSGQLWTTERFSEGTTITVTSEVALPDPAQLDAIGETLSFSTDKAWIARYTELPTVFSPRVRALAKEITADQPNPYRKLIALQGYLRSSRFTYDDDARVPEGTDPLLYFLQTSRRGFCQQFAGTFAAMSRSLGYPTRVAVGFQQGVDQVREGSIRSFLVTSHEAHAWPEVFFPSIGWVPFEPTPTRNNPLAQGYLNPAPIATRSTTAPAAPVDVGAGRDPNSRPLRQRHSGQERAGLATAERAGTTGWLLRLLALITLLTLAAAAWGPVRHLARRVTRQRRQRRRKRVPGTAHLVLGAWDRFEFEADELGLGRTPGETVIAFAQRIPIASAKGLAHVTQIAAYGAGEVEPALARGSVHTADAAIKELRELVPLRRRVGGWYRGEPVSWRDPIQPLSPRREAP